MEEKGEQWGCKGEGLLEGSLSVLEPALRCDSRPSALWSVPRSQPSVGSRLPTARDDSRAGLVLVRPPGVKSNLQVLEALIGPGVLSGAFVVDRAAW